MEIILKQEIDGLGSINDVVTVKNGYARNYLIPQRKAVIANKANLREVEQQLRFKRAAEEQLLAQIDEIKERLANTTIKVGAKVGTTDKIFGSITTYHLAEAIKAQGGVDVDRRKIKILEEEIKTLGTYQADVQLHKEHEVTINFEVISE